MVTIEMPDKTAERLLEMLANEPPLLLTPLTQLDIDLLSVELKHALLKCEC